MNFNLSIITPHKNDFDGLMRIYNLLQNQTSLFWEWIIVDDYSDEDVILKIKNFQNKSNDNKLNFFFNNENLNASKSRNIGANNAKYENLVFLDSDDIITEEFVKNRNIFVAESIYFINLYTINKNGQTNKYSHIEDDFFNNYLKCKFVWQTSAILWNKKYFDLIGQFDIKLPLLQDVEISLRALYNNKEINVIKMQPDFYYFIEPINIKKRNFAKVSLAIDLFLNIIHDNFNLSIEKMSYLQSYYYLSVKYFCRTKEYNKTDLLINNLKNIYNKNMISIYKYIFARLLIFIFKHKLISSALFLKTNRNLFKIT